MGSAVTGKAALSQYHVIDAPPSMYYVPNFITAEEETAIINKAIPSQLTKSNTLLTSLSTPLPSWLADPCVSRIERLGCFSDAPHGINHCLVNEYHPGQGIMAHEDGAAYWPVVATVSLGGSTVLDIVEKKERPSLDRGAEKEEPRRIQEAEGGRKKSWRIFQPARSLLVTSGSAYVDTLHGIADVTCDKNLGPETVANWDLLGDEVRGEIEAAGGVRHRESTRVSLTFRDVSKVVNVGSRIFGKTR